MQEALEQGLLSAEHAVGLELEQVPVMPLGHSSEDMALAAARGALAEAGQAPADLDLCLYAAGTESEKGWKIAPRIARLLGAKRAVAFSVRQMSNANAMAIQIALAHLLAEPRTTSALVVTGDGLGPDNPERWHGRTETVMGDGATALVLARRRGRLAIRSVASYGSPEQEADFPHLHPLRDSSYGQHPETVARPGLSELMSREKLTFLIRRRMRAAVSAALADAGLPADDPRLAWVLQPRFTSPGLQRLMSEATPPQCKAEHLRPVHATGHFAAGDVTLNLEHLTNRCPVQTGQYTLLLSFGAGFACTVLVVEVLTDSEVRQ
ncbi:hypothetical protein RND61_03050 [Streptomyces sp. TRM76323]|uniref:3-oxoacyl-ACP synthase n=1 Tax=Streptomyces tamarix TaxID=3078565 RepID=A0ABU3QE82_9ACTN|nr:hypothetical protein [Streptomyces tamarix]MDT9681059.1 hypothetical protein [Streptomyces tamarix]